MDHRNDKTVVVITGATASGKTAIAIRLASKLQTEIISADSRQCYKELNIGVARPSEEELTKVPHHFIASHSIHESVNAGTFQHYALRKAQELFKTHDTVVMAGGTGLYIRAFVEGIDRIPEVPSEVRQQIIGFYKEKGLQWLQAEVKRRDPEYFRLGESQNPQRLMRALEVAEATGQSILTFQKGRKERRHFRIVKIGVDVAREELQRRINARVDRMIENGLIGEVKNLVPFKNLNALQTVGYSELFVHLDQNISLTEAIELIKRNTRQYAKRQMTWFRKDPEISWRTEQQIEGLKDFDLQ